MSLAACLGGGKGCLKPQNPSCSVQCPLQRITAPKATSRHLRSIAMGAGGSWEQLLSPSPGRNQALLQQVLSSALELLSGRLKELNADRDRVCHLSYADSRKQYTPLPAAVRQAFADLENEDDDEDALNTLCLLTYSEDECAQSSSSSSSQKRIATSAAAFALLSNESTAKAGDQSAVGTMMETLCLLSYDEDE